MKLGTNDIGSVYLGTNAVQKVYLGTNEVWSATSLLLDTYSGAAAAYSLRLLRSAYTGNAIKVRRSSDNTEQDIGFVDNELDTSTLATFCSSTNGFVTTWYDQSGNGYDATQSTAANQPQIVSSGSVITENGKPCVDFDGSKHLSVWNNVTAPSYFQTLNEPLSIFTIDKPDNISGTSTAADWGAVYTIAEIRLNAFPIEATFNIGYYDSSYNLGMFDSTNASRNLTSNTSTVQQLNSSFRDNTQIDIYRDSSSEYSQSVTIGDCSIGSGNSSFTIGVRTRNGGQPDSNFYDGKLQEFILYGSDQSSNRTGIETNINDFYSIY